MYRDEALRPLSRQHHIALVFAKTLRQWRRKEVSQARQRQVAEAAHRFWEVELIPHFRAEEETLLGRWDRPGTDPVVTRVLQEHLAIHRVAQRLGRALREGHISVAWDEALRMGDCVHAHIRFEERSWLPELEAEMSSDLLAEAATSMDRAMDPSEAEAALPPRPESHGQP
ncbi:MAG: hemerythrin domain-containing protein [Thiohalorhabdaceae bacterium]